jgi:hypothetical protein
MFLNVQNGPVGPWTRTTVGRTMPMMRGANWIPDGLLIACALASVASLFVTLG